MRFLQPYGIASRGYHPRYVCTTTRFEKSLKYSVVNPHSSVILAEYIRNVGSPDSDFFTVEEIRFLMQVCQACSHLTKQQIESNRRELEQEMRQGGHILIIFGTAIY